MTLTIPDTDLSWSRGLASLSPGVVPCRGLRPDEWCETHRLCGEFVERWGMQAHAAGWDTLHAFERHDEMESVVIFSQFGEVPEGFAEQVSGG